jgi:hypothetical protein
MRNQRLFGVVIAVLLGTSFFHQRPSSSHHHHQGTTTHLSRGEVQLASASVPVDLSRASLAEGDDLHIGLLRPAGTRYVKMLYSWMAYEKVHAPPPPPSKPKATPTPAPHAAVVQVPPATRPAAGDVWAGLRRCESGGNYTENTGNGYYGAYQFSLATWHGLGFGGLPSSAPPAVQDQAAQELQARSGWGQWPSCSHRLSLT